MLVGYFADRFKKKNTMALFYLLLGGAIPLLYIAHRPLRPGLRDRFRLCHGADYMLIPLVTAECFAFSLGKLLALSSWDIPSGNGCAVDGRKNFRYLS